MLTEEIENEKLLILLKSVFEQKLTEVFTKLNKNNLEAIIIKGWAVSRFYDKPYMRGEGDLDLVIRPRDTSKFNELFKDTERDKFSIDLHEGLRHLDTIDIEVAFKNSNVIKLNNVDVRVLSEEDHLRIICVHWLNDGGERKDRLRDIFYLIKNRKKHFDWDKCLNVVDKNRKQWIMSVIVLTSKYLKLQIDELPEEIREFEPPKWVYKSIEKSWKKKYPYIPFNAVGFSPKMIIYQIYRRFPPNPLMSMIGVEGNINTKHPIKYQVKYFFQRIIPSIKYVREKYFKNKV